MQQALYLGLVLQGYFSFSECADAQQFLEWQGPLEKVFWFWSLIGQKLPRVISKYIVGQ